MDKINRWENEKVAGKFYISEYGVSFEWNYKNTFGQERGSLPLDMFVEIAKEVHEFLLGSAEGKKL